MRFFRFTLLTDGSSDRALIPYLKWLLKQNGVNLPIVSEWANEGLSRLREKPANLAERIQRSVELYPCDLLFIRDVERETIEARKREVEQALNQLKGSELLFVGVFPIRMMEAWLLIDKRAIRSASGNPNGKVSFGLPRLRDIESEPDPKKKLQNLLMKASERTGRRLNNFNISHHIFLVAENIEDFSPLRSLSAFALLEADIKQSVQKFNSTNE